MNFTLSPALLDLQQRTRAFIADEVIPCERDSRCTPHGPEESLRADLVGRARRAGLLSSHMPARRKRPSRSSKTCCWLFAG